MLLQSTFWLMRLSPIDAGFFKGERIRDMDRISKELLARSEDVQIRLDRDYSVISASGVDGGECGNIRVEMKRLRMEECRSNLSDRVVQWFFRNPWVGFLSVLEYRESTPDEKFFKQSEKRYTRYTFFHDAMTTNWYFGWVVPE